MVDDIHNKLTLAGQIVETLLREGRQVAKISFRTCHIFVSMDAIPEAHLGDTVIIDADISVHKVKPYLDAALHDRGPD